MKKLICLCLSLMLCLGAMGALAETAADYTADEISVSIPETKEGLGKVDLGESARALKSTDDVVNRNGVYTVKTATGLNLQLDASNLPYLVLTQSYYASLDIYSRFQDDAVAVEYIDSLISDNIHFLIWDAYDAFSYIYVRSLGADSLSQHVRDLATLNENEVAAVANAIAMSADLDSYSVYTFNGNVWIQLGANALITIKNSEYVQTIYMPNGDKMTEDDYTDYTEFMNALTLD